MKIDVIKSIILYRLWYNFFQFRYDMCTQKSKTKNKKHKHKHIPFLLFISLVSYKYIQLWSNPWCIHILCIFNCISKIHPIFLIKFLFKSDIQLLYSFLFVIFRLFIFYILLKVNTKEWKQQKLEDYIRSA